MAPKGGRQINIPDTAGFRYYMAELKKQLEEGGQGIADEAELKKKGAGKWQRLAKVKKTQYEEMAATNREEEDDEEEEEMGVDDEQEAQEDEHEERNDNGHDSDEPVDEDEVESDGKNGDGKDRRVQFTSSSEDDKEEEMENEEMQSGEKEIRSEEEEIEEAASPPPVKTKKTSGSRGAKTTAANGDKRSARNRGSDKPIVASREKAKKDPDAPKRPMNAFLLFSSDFRSKVKAENPSFNLGQIGREIGKMWKEISEAKKAPYLKKAEEDKKKYDQNLKEYKARKSST